MGSTKFTLSSPIATSPDATTVNEQTSAPRDAFRDFSVARVWRQSQRAIRPVAALRPVRRSFNSLDPILANRRVALHLQLRITGSLGTTSKRFKLRQLPTRTNLRHMEPARAVSI